MKLTIEDIYELMVINCPGTYEVFESGDEIPVVDKVTLSKGVTQIIVQDTNGNLFSCVYSESYDDHGNRYETYGPTVDNTVVERYDGTFITGFWSSEIELTPVEQHIEIVEIKRYIAKGK